jgi:hypothetical protein
MENGPGEGCFEFGIEGKNRPAVPVIAARPFFLVLAAACSLVLASCASHRDAADASLSPAQIVEKIHRRNDHISTLAGRGSMSFETPETGGSAYFTMNLRKPDSLLVQFEGPFGIGGGFLFACRQKYVMYNGLENRVTTGVPNTQTIRGLLPVDLSLPQILDAFAGSFPLPESAPAESRVETDGIRLDYQLPSMRDSYWIDTEAMMVVKYQRTNARGDLLIEGKVTRIREEQGVPFPHVITLAFPAESKGVTLYYNDVDMNAEELTFDYAVPPSARTTIR